MKAPRWICRAIYRWQLWRLERAFPERRTIRMQIEQARKNHRRVDHLYRALRDSVTEALKRETEARQ